MTEYVEASQSKGNFQAKHLARIHELRLHLRNMNDCYFLPMLGDIALRASAISIQTDPHRRGMHHCNRNRVPAPEPQPSNNKPCPRHSRCTRETSCEAVCPASGISLSTGRVCHPLFPFSRFSSSHPRSVHLLSFCWTLGNPSWLSGRSNVAFINTPWLAVLYILNLPLCLLFSSSSSLLSHPLPRL
jgi:hypothetical protein